MEDNPIFEQGGYYNPKVSGSLEEYLTEFNGRMSFPLFKGIEQFNMLKKRDYFIPNRSIIRLMWNSERGDEHFLVNEIYQLFSLESGVHSGREGTHKPKKILDENVRWEPHELNRKQIRKDFENLEKTK